MATSPAQAHRFTFGRELELEQRERQGRSRCVGGSPADCVVAGMTHVCKDLKPDLVLSGVNNGQNLGRHHQLLRHRRGRARGRAAGRAGHRADLAGRRTTSGATDIDWTNSKKYAAGVVRRL